MAKSIKEWLDQKDGATAIEYSLIVAGIALAVSVFIFAFGEELFAFFEFLTGVLDGQV